MFFVSLDKGGGLIQCLVKTIHCCFQGTYITYITFKNVSIFFPRFLSIDSLSFAMYMDAETWMQLSRSWLGKSIHLLWVFHGLMSFCWAHHGDMIEICFTNLT